MCCTRLAGNTGRKNDAKIAICAPSHNLSSYIFATSASIDNQKPNFARCLAVSWAGTLYIHFRVLLPPDGILPGAKFTLRPSHAFYYIGSVTAGHSSSRRQPNFLAWYKELSQRAPPIFGWAAITLGIGPHSSFIIIINQPRNMFHER